MGKVWTSQLPAQLMRQKINSLAAKISQLYTHHKHLNFYIGTQQCTKKWLSLIHPSICIDSTKAWYVLQGHTHILVTGNIFSKDQNLTVFLVVPQQVHGETIIILQQRTPELNHPSLKVVYNLQYFTLTLLHHPPVGVAQAAMALCLVNVCLKNFFKNLNGLLTNQPKQ